MKRKASSMLLIAVFLVVLFCPHVIWRLFSRQLDGSTEEKRELAKRPVFALEEMAAYPKDFEAYYNDHLPFRNWLIKFYNSMQYHIFHTSSNENVILGKEGWLFYSSKKDGISLPIYDGSLLLWPEELEQIRNNLLDAKERLAEQGIEFVVMIAPNKERVYSEYMPDYLGEPASEYLTGQIISDLRTHTDIKVVYPLEEMLAFKKEHPDLYMYYQMDTHWNNLGGYIGARALLAQLGIEISPLDQMEISYEEKGDGDLKSLLNLWGVSQNHPDPYLKRQDDVHPVTICEAYSGRSEYEMQDAPQISLMMHRDSFGVDLAEHIKYHLSRTVLLHNSMYEGRYVWEEKPDVFVLEIVERNIGRLRNPVL